MMQKLNYIPCGDYYIPNIRLPEEKDILSVGTNTQRLFQGA